jgi:hypothetical protein
LSWIEALWSCLLNRTRLPAANFAAAVGRTVLQTPVRSARRRAPCQAAGGSSELRAFAGVRKARRQSLPAGMGSLMERDGEADASGAHVPARSDGLYRPCRSGKDLIAWLAR